MIYFSCFYSQSRFSMTQTHSCRSQSTFHLSQKLISTYSRLTAWKAYRYWKEEVDTSLFNIIWRHGLLYFFVIFSMNVVNVIIFLTAPQALRAVNLTLVG